MCGMEMCPDVWLCVCAHVRCLQEGLYVWVGVYRREAGMSVCICDLGQKL